MAAVKDTTKQWLVKTNRLGRPSVLYYNLSSVYNSVSIILTWSYEL